MLEFYLKGGWLMHPILLCSILMLTIVIERMIYFFRVRSGNVAKHFARIEQHLKTNNITEAQKIVNGLPGPIGHVIQLGFEAQEEKIEVIEENMAITGETIVREASKGLSLLALIPSISTLLGLLGTIIGLSLAFKKVAGLEEHVSPALLASGIWVSLITTVAGLSVAIPGLIAHHFIQSRVSRLTFEIEHYGNRLLLLLKKQKFHPETADEKRSANPRYDTPDFQWVSQKGNPNVAD